MSNEILLVQIMSLVGGLLLTYLGFRLTFSKKTYMRLTEGYIKDDFESQYRKLSLHHRLLRRYQSGLGGLCTGIMLLAFFIWLTFFQ